MVVKIEKGTHQVPTPGHPGTPRDTPDTPGHVSGFLAKMTYLVLGIWGLKVV